MENEIEIPAGQVIYKAAERAVEHAKKTGKDCSFEFNGIKMTATKESSAYDINRIYLLKSELRSIYTKYPFLIPDY